MVVHSVHGSLLRALRTEDGLRQQDVATSLGLSRSTLANIEAGREAVSEGLFGRLLHAFPQWRESLESRSYLPAPTNVNASFTIVELTITYVFEESRSPSEIIQIRRVRAIRSGPQHFVLGLKRTDEQSFTTETNVLWGGHLADEAPDENGNTMQVVAFPNPLRAGQVHEFALRSWVERDVEASTELQLVVTRRTDRARIHLACHGKQQIAAAWEFGPIDEPEDEVPRRSPDARALTVEPLTPITATFDHLTPHRTYGIAWEW